MSIQADLQNPELGYHDEGMSLTDPGLYESTRQAFGLATSEDLVGEVELAGINGLTRSFHARKNLAVVEDIQRISAQCFLQAIAILANMRKAVIWLLGHRLVHHLADGAAHGLIQLRNQRWNPVQDGLNRFVGRGAFEWPAP